MKKKSHVHGLCVFYVIEDENIVDYSHGIEGVARLNVLETYS